MLLEWQQSSKHTVRHNEATACTSCVLACAWMSVDTSATSTTDFHWTHPGLLERDEGAEETAAAVLVGGFRLEGGVSAHGLAKEVQGRGQRLKSLNEQVVRRRLQLAQHALHHRQAAVDPEVIHHLPVDGSGAEPLLGILDLLPEEPLQLWCVG